MMELAHKKGGPYSKDEQRKRRDEVYRLHFEYGYSARKISEFLKINRGTINRDIMYWHVNIVKKWRHLDPEIFVMNQIERFELQRTRLRKQLDSLQSFQEKITVEKFIFNIDMKIGNLQVRLVDAKSKIKSHAANQINRYFKEKKVKRRVLTSDVFVEVSDKALEKIFKIYDEDIKF